MVWYRIIFQNKVYHVDKPILKVYCNSNMTCVSISVHRQIHRNDVSVMSEFKQAVCVFRISMRRRYLACSRGCRSWRPSWRGSRWFCRRRSSSSKSRSVLLVLPQLDWWPRGLCSVASHTSCLSGLQLAKNTKSSSLLKELHVENAQLMSALQVTEQRQKNAEKKNFLLEGKVSALNKLLRDVVHVALATWRRHFSIV